MNKQEWLKERKNYLGGTDLAAICGLSPYRTALDVYLDKTSDDITCETNAAMRWGTLLEEAVAKAYSEDTGLNVEIEPNTIYHPEYKFLGANIDRWVGNKEYVLECKTAGFNRGKEWGEVGTDQIPESYLVQVAYYGAICDVPKVDIAVLIGGQDFRIYTYERNKELEEKLIKIACNFWHNHIEKRIPPKCSNTRDTFNLFPQSNYHEIVAEDNIMEKLEELKGAKEEESRIQDTIERLKTDIQEFMRDYGVLVDHQGNVIATWKNTAPKSLVNVSKLKEMFKEAYEQCLNTGRSSRMFLVK
ncbi:MAG: YqaJ viral recombinase family protein [Rickettsia sp.]|jgi:putative phage-type endonuclease|nr:YqaJ viral recombinase family protein [Rickettsia sp.]